MKTLHLLRHAKSSWDHPDLLDSERPLNTRGFNDAKIMVEQILEAGCTFDNIFCSTAKRAQLTIETIAKHLSTKSLKWTLTDDLYTFEDSVLLQWVQSLPNNLENVMIVGHNPAITDFVNAVGDQFIENVATCGYVQLKCDVDDWYQVQASNAETLAFLKPKMFKT